MEDVKMEELTIPITGKLNTRKSQNEEGPPKKKRKKNKSEMVVSSQKNPVMALNEIKPNLVYDIVESGPPHARLYSASVEINGKTYSGCDSTKKKAKARVAQMILQCSVQLRDPSIKAPLALMSEDFSQDLTEIVRASEDFFSFESAMENSVIAAPIVMQNSAENAQNNPVFCLNKLKPGNKIEIVKEDGSPHAKVYTARVVVEDQTFEGTGTSKKHAKNEAAQLALKTIFKMELPKPYGSAVNVDKEGDPNFGDFIANLVEGAYQNIMKNEQQTIARYKVLAGVVMTSGPTADGATVICVTTGSKCINGGQLSMEGEALNDCHAEILARRGLLSYLYDKLTMYDVDPCESIFEPAPTGPDQCRLKLKSHVLFHLYVSSAPCGDARIFTLNESVASPLADPHPNRQGRGALRTKIESGEGTVPVNDSVIQTWDGILQGERLLTMSCSDKMARWNVVGLQGSLLSHIIHPIYLHTVVVGNLFHQVHLRRALIGRIEHLQGLPSPFVFSRPVLTNVSSPPDRLPAKSPKHSICWTLGWPSHETIDISKGTLTDGSTSQLSKRRFFQRFLALATLRREWKSLVEPYVRNGHVAYLSLKHSARRFVEAKEMLQTSLVVAKLGKWVKKPLEQDSFEILYQQDDDIKQCSSPLGF